MPPCSKVHEQNKITKSCLKTVRLFKTIFIERQTAVQIVEMEKKKILWVRLDAIGDTILAASMLQPIYEKFGGAKITAVCERVTAELYEASPFVERVIPVDQMRLYFDSKYRNEIVHDLQKESFDMALDTTCSWVELGDLFVVGSLAREKIAFENVGAIPEETMAKRRKVFTRLVKFDRPYEPEMERYRDFLKALDIDVPALNATLWTTPEDQEFARRTFSENGLLPEKTLALFAFGRSHLRTYPYYGEALADVCRGNGFSVVALGDSSAYGFNESCLEKIGVRSVNLSGKMTLRQTAAVMRKCNIAVGAETGLAHMACAVGIPNVIVIGGGHIGRFMPYTSKTSLVTLPLECFDCDWKCKFPRAYCVSDVAPEVIEFAVRRTLARDSEKPRMFVHPKAAWDGTGKAPAWKVAAKFIRPEDVEVIEVDFEPKRKKSGTAHGGDGRSMPGYIPIQKPKAVEEAFEKASSLRDTGKIEEAMAVLDDAVEKDGQFPDLMNLKAELNLQTGNLEAAKEILWGAIMKFPFNVQLLNNVAVIEIMQRRYDSALALLHRTLEIEPGNEAALVNVRYIENELHVRRELIRAEQLILNEDPGAARLALDEILKAYPEHEDALSDLAVIEAREGKSGEALRLLQQVLAGNPQNEFAAQLMDKLLLSA